MNNCPRCHEGGPCPECPKPTPEVLYHALHKIDEECRHEWNQVQDPEFCTKCQISFTRYIFSIGD